MASDEMRDQASEAPYLSAFSSGAAKDLVGRFVQQVVSGPSSSDASAQPAGSSSEAVHLAEAALNAFLQANVTGPVLQAGECEALFSSAYARQASPPPARGLSGIEALRRLCLRSLDIDGVSVYAYIPHVELFCLARWILTSDSVVPSSPEQAWLRFRIHLWHFKLLSQPSLSSGSLFTKSGRWTDVATLQELVEKSLGEAEATVMQAAERPKQEKVQFLLEKAGAHTMLGNDVQAKEALRAATEQSGFTYALSGALGKKTKFQEKNISQLVVLAKSADDGVAHNSEETGEAPQAVPLNDDTLLDKISFSADNAEAAPSSELPAPLQGLSPENQPQLTVEDQIILLTEATLKDTFSAADSLTSEEILPFAVRVIEDKSTNWQVYTQALIVRSRIELNRSRTLERGVLQMQALVDQIIVDTDAPAAPAAPSANDGTPKEEGSEPSVPSIQVSGDGEAAPAPPKPTSFLPAAKPSESASAQTRLRYVNMLSSPPRWHLEAELANAWASVGSLVSALEIFKRLRQWPEVALCLATSGAQDDDSGRGRGGEEKARAVLRWRLFHRLGETAESMEDEDDGKVVDVDSLNLKDFYGPARSPPPPNAPRLLCILGDLENDAKHYERAWEVSNRRYARAQRSLGELHLRNQDWQAAAEAYQKAVAVNRLSPEVWSRLGDIYLRLGQFPDAAQAFQRAISSSNGEAGGEDARTWSNMGTALLSWYQAVVKEGKVLRAQGKPTEDGGDTGRKTDEELEREFPASSRASDLGKSAQSLLQDALGAFKRGATTANTNWRIWDNVITLAASLKPTPAFDDVILATSNVLRIRKTEDALDTEILALLVREVSKEPAGEGEGVYEPPRGTLASKVVGLFEREIVPLITANSDAWSLVARLRAWRRDYAGALDAAEKAWRAATASAGSGSALSASTGTGVAKGSWLEDREGWETVVSRTDELVAAYENWGARVESVGDRWRGKARSAVRSVMSKAKENWEGTEGWQTLENAMEGLKL